MRILILLGVASLLRANSLTFTAAPVPGGVSYHFTLNNTGDTGGTLFDLFLSLPADISNIQTATIRTAPGWGDAAGGLLFFGPDVSPSTSFIEWAADFSGSFDLGIGASLSGFSFTANRPVGAPVRFALNGSTTFALAQLVAIGVPEPGTFLSLATAAILSAGFLRRRRRRSALAFRDPVLGLVHHRADK